MNVYESRSSLTLTRLLSATGMLGTGFPEESLRAGMAMKPDMIGCDAGSTDSGPADLATGRCRYPAEAYRRDLRLLLPAALASGIPLIIGSAGGAGGDENVEWARHRIDEVAAELGLSFRMAVLYSGQRKEWIAQQLAAGRVSPLPNGPQLTTETIERTITIVGMMGAEPIIRALEAGADVVLAGRATDTSIFAAVPLMRGAAPGPTWHAAKILECGAAAVEQRPAPDSMFAVIDGDSFTVVAPNSALRCTTVSVAAHSLYENASPFHIVEPSGVLDTTKSQYRQVSDRQVEVAGSTFHAAERYTVKLEGVALAGYQTIVVAGIRDPVLLEELDSFLAACHAAIAQRVRQSHPRLTAHDWSVYFRVYGRDGTMGQLEPVRQVPHEVGLIIEVTGRSQEIANDVAAISRHQTLHQSVAGWKGFLSNIALPYGGTDLVRGPVYEFCVNSVVEPDNPYQMFRTSFVEYPSRTRELRSGVAALPVPNA
jgi:hypothetical protein